MSQSLRRGVPGKGWKPQKGCPRMGGGGRKPQQGTSSQNTRPERLFIADTQCKLILGSPKTVTVYTINSWKRCFSRGFALSLPSLHPKVLFCQGCLVAPCGWEFNRGRGCGWESRPLSRFCFTLVLKEFSTQNHYRAVEPPKWFRTRRLRTPTCIWMRDRAR